LENLANLCGKSFSFSESETLQEEEVIHSLVVAKGMDFHYDSEWQSSNLRLCVVGTTQAISTERERRESAPLLASQWKSCLKQALRVMTRNSIKMVLRPVMLTLCELPKVPIHLPPLTRLSVISIIKSESS